MLRSKTANIGDAILKPSCMAEGKATLLKDLMGPMESLFQYAALDLMWSKPMPDWHFVRDVVQPTFGKHAWALSACTLVKAAIDRPPTWCRNHMAHPAHTGHEQPRLMRCAEDGHDMPEPHSNISTQSSLEVMLVQSSLGLQVRSCRQLSSAWLRWRAWKSSGAGAPTLMQGSSTVRQLRLLPPRIWPRVLLLKQSQPALTRMAKAPVPVRALTLRQSGAQMLAPAHAAACSVSHDALSCGSAMQLGQPESALIGERTAVHRLAALHAASNGAFHAYCWAGCWPCSCPNS